ncbi:hypothetical protein MMC25_000985 [Agyrium rufum]|nr:hypothetical protein [Agyrium rufum]
MSSDLWKEFGGGDQSRPIWEHPALHSNPAIDEDDFGDFEDPTNTEESLNISATVSQTRWNPPQNPSEASKDILGLCVDHRQGSKTAPPVVSLNPKVRSTTMKPVVPSNSKYGLRSQELRRDMPPPTKVETAPVSEADDEEEWADFETVKEKPSSIEAIETDGRHPDLPSKAGTISSPLPASHISSTKNQTAKPNSQTFTRPHYIPPPSVLIAHTAVLISRLPGQIEAAMEEVKSKGISPKIVDKALRNCISALRVAARIMAGRKNRWIRETALAQSMRIGHAQGGKSGGMKLTGVDKAEVQRENGEAAELVRVWRSKLGQIRGALALVNAQIAGKPLALPEIAETLPVQVAKDTAPGAASDRTVCALCGLRRAERVAKVDVDVWDTSGEFWSNLWGHTECRLLWEQHSQLLMVGVFGS